MARIQQYHSQVSAQTGAPSPISSPADFGVGTGTGELGKNLDKIGDFLEKKKDREDQLWQAKQGAESRSFWTTELIKRQSEAPEGAPNFSATFISDFDKHTAEAIKAAPSADVAKQMEVNAIGLRGHFLEKTTLFEAAASAKQVRRGEEGIHEADKNSVRLDPSQYEAVLAKTNERIASLPLSAEHKAKMVDDWREELAYSAGAGTILNAKGVAAAKGVRDEFRSKDNKWAGTLSAQNFTALLTAAERNLEGAEREALRAQADGEKKRDVSATAAYVDLMNRQQKGENVGPEIAMFRSAYGDTTQGLMKWSHLQSSENKFAREEAFQRNEIRRVTAASTDSGPQLDPYTKADRDAVDAHYPMMVDQWQKTAKNPGDPVEMAAKMVGYAKSIGVVPTDMKTFITSGLNNPSKPESVVQSAALMDQLFAANDQFKNQFSREQISFGTEVNTYVRAGAAPGKAVEMVSESRRVPEAQKKAREEDFKILTQASTPEKALKARYSSWFSRNPDADSVMAREFEDVRRHEFTKTGNIDAANETAFKVVEGSWGVSLVNGKSQLMKYAPEKFYGVPGMDAGANAAWMREQLVSDVKAGAISEPGIESRIELTPHPSKRLPDGRPMYQVILKTPSARNVLRDTKGEPMAWAPDYKRSKDYAEREEMKVRQLEAGRMLRAGQSSDGKARSSVDINNAIIEASDPYVGRF